ncbi:MAG TPA: DUF1489 domain-containing protein [Rickettsiales bacterium]|nr:DUF1489 domain-containing protein [Rickettsiales bacterium]
MTKYLHLIKLAVGPRSLKDLQDWQTRLACEKAAKGQKGEIIHITRSTPKRAEEVLAGGSIYWVIKGFIVGRNRILELRPMMYDDMPHCGIVYEPELIRVTPQPRRPFQGWRYLEGKDAPPDLEGDIRDMPDPMLRELAELGLL